MTDENLTALMKTVNLVFHVPIQGAYWVKNKKNKGNSYLGILRETTENQDQKKILNLLKGKNRLPQNTL